MKSTYDALELVSDDYYDQLDLNYIISEYKRTRVEKLVYENMLRSANPALAQQKSLNKVMEPEPTVFISNEDVNSGVVGRGTEVELRKLDTVGRSAPNQVNPHKSFSKIEDTGNIGEHMERVDQKLASLEGEINKLCALIPEGQRIEEIKDLRESTDAGATAAMERKAAAIGQALDTDQSMKDKTVDEKILFLKLN